jgi:hypothetical protein
MNRISGLYDHWCGFFIFVSSRRKVAEDEDYKSYLLLSSSPIPSSTLVKFLSAKASQNLDQRYNKFTI